MSRKKEQEEAVGDIIKLKGKKKRNMRTSNKRRTKRRMAKRKGCKEEAEGVIKLKRNKKRKK